MPTTLCVLSCDHKDTRTRFPDGLLVEGDLFVNLTRSFSELPKGLVVGGDLRIEACSQWDGIIPDDAAIGGHVVCDDFPYFYDNGNRAGVLLPTWRAFHEALPNALATGTSRKDLAEAMWAAEAGHSG